MQIFLLKYVEAKYFWPELRTLLEKLGIEKPTKYEEKELNKMITKWTLRFPDQTIDY